MNDCVACRDFGKDELHSDHWPVMRDKTPNASAALARNSSTSSGSPTSPSDATHSKAKRAKSKASSSVTKGSLA